MEELLKQLIEGQKEMKQDISEMKHSLTRMEQEQGNKISALFDARELQIDSNKRTIDTLNRIETTLERLSFRVSFNDTQLKQIK